VTDEPAPWWYSQNEERLDGHRPTRDEAIAAGVYEYGGDPFLICQGNHFKYQAPAFDIDRIAEDFDDANCEYGPEDDGPAAQWSDKACEELETALAAAFDAWLDKHDYRKAWAIDCREYERIDPAMIEAGKEKP